MYGCYDPDYVYGIIDDTNCRYLIFDDKEIEKLGLEIYGQDVIRHHLGNAVYGISVNKIATKEQKEKVKKAMNYLKQNYKKTENLKAGYFLVIKGYDWEIEHELYESTDDSKNSET